MEKPMTIKHQNPDFDGSVTDVDQLTMLTTPKKKTPHRLPKKKAVKRKP